jgi:hypothetical protein
MFFTSPLFAFASLTATTTSKLSFCTAKDLPYRKHGQRILQLIPQYRIGLELGSADKTQKGLRCEQVEYNPVANVAAHGGRGMRVSIRHASTQRFPTLLALYLRAG